MIVTKPFPQPGPIFQAEGMESTVFFTFDVLWQAEDLEILLRCLEEQEVKAIFFITGEWLKKNYQEAKKIIDFGHYLGNKTLSHGKLLLMTEEEIAGEIGKFNELCIELLDYRPFFFRPPYGEYNARIVRIAKEQKMHTLLWSINLKTLSERSTELILNHLEECLHDGAILLCHASFPRIIQILPEIITFIKWKGYKIETPDLLKDMLQ